MVHSCTRDSLITSHLKQRHHSATVLTPRPTVTHGLIIHWSGQQTCLPHDPFHVPRFNGRAEFRPPHPSPYVFHPVRRGPRLLFRQINRFFQITPHERRRQFAVVPPQHFLGHPPGTDIVIQWPRGGRTALHKPVHVRQRVGVGDLSHTAPDLFANLFVRALVVDPKRGFRPVCGAPQQMYTTRTTTGTTTRTPTRC